jgi:hypothetical protein
MPGNNLGPSEKEVGPRGNPEGTDNTYTTDSHHKTGFRDSSAGSRRCSGDTVAGLHRRRAASQRLVRLVCGCADPWPCRCYDSALSEKRIEAAAQAAAHLLAENLPPLLDVELLRALYRRGGDDRKLAEQLRDLCGWKAA